MFVNVWHPEVQRLLGQTSVDIRLRRKSLFLVADLAEQSHQLHGGQLDSILKISLDASNSMDLFNEGLLKAVVNLVEAPDLDTLEKVRGTLWLSTLDTFILPLFSLVLGLFLCCFKRP